ncbi:hypothetical protein J6590_045056 [Homalodisca vitripennis]|nr:hypothetical protein J6590_045056 [Homalodisca vitripennis]
MVGTTSNRFPSKTSSLRREPVQSQGSLSVSGSGSGNCSRELSPVRWCDREVDGVYLGRSGWVQVQQRSLDDNRRVAYTPPKPPVAVNTSHNIPPRLKMSDFHSRSEPGKFPQVDDVPQQRPGFLPLPNEPKRTREKPSPSSLDLHHEEPITPPPVTPIISPPPAFQDSNKRFLTTTTSNRARTVSSKPPVLTRANAVESSPPPSPPATLNWSSTLSAQKISPISSVPLRPKRLTPSPVSTPQQHGIPQTKSLEDASGIRRTVFQKYDSSSSSSSSFGFRSLDSNIGVRIGMPRLNETDSSLGGYEDGDEEDNLSSSLNLSGYSSVTMVNSSPDAMGFHSIIPTVERVSPSSLRGRQHHRQMRRSPGSDGSNKKLGSNQVSPTSSSSSSSSRSPSAGPFRRSGSHNKPTQHHRDHVTATWDGRGSRVRRSRSLQLPERKSPASSGGASPAGRPELEPIHREYYHGKQDPPRVVVKINGEQPLRTKRHGLQRTAQSEELQREREREREREAEEEARVVTEFLYGARSREAARALIMQRCLEQRSPEPASVPGVFSNRGRIPSSVAQRPKVLQRGVTTPSLGSKSSSPVGNNQFCTNPCNPSTCDFWPHCAHRDGIHTTTTTKSFTPLANTPVPPATLRLSQSYPNTVNHTGYKDRRGRDRGRIEGVRNGYQSTRSSPASLERMNEHEVSPTKHYPKRGNSLNVPTPTIDVDWRNVGPQCRQHSHMPMRGNVQNSPQAPGLKVGLSDTSSSAGSSMDAVEPGVYRAGMIVTSAVSPDPVKVSPIEVNSVIVNTGESSASSSSSDIWVTTSDRTMTKSPRNAKSSGASTPLEEGRTSKSPVRMSDEDHSRPGSAPAHQDRMVVDTQQRSLSLPKSFQSAATHVRHRLALFLSLSQTHKPIV